MSYPQKRFSEFTHTHTQKKAPSFGRITFHSKKATISLSLSVSFSPSPPSLYLYLSVIASHTLLSAVNPPHPPTSILSSRIRLVFVVLSSDLPPPPPPPPTQPLARTHALLDAPNSPYLFSLFGKFSPPVHLSLSLSQTHRHTYISHTHTHAHTPQCFIFRFPICFHSYACVQLWPFKSSVLFVISVHVGNVGNIFFFSLKDHIRWIHKMLLLLFSL